MKPILLISIAVACVIGATILAYFTLGDGAMAPVAAPATPKAPAGGPVDAAQSAKAEADMARLRDENTLLKQQLDNMRAELAKLQQQAALEKASHAEAKAAPGTKALDADEFWGDVQEATAGDREGKERGERRNRGEWSAERGAQFREMANQFYDDAIAQGGTPEVQERLSALRDYSNQMMDLREQIRSAEDGPAKDALREEMDLLRDEMKPLMREQQDYLLRQAAQNAGVTDARTQQQLTNTIRDTIRSPFFTMGNGPGQGGGGGRGGGPR
jgi:DNA polymerase III gamma/tau subunit